MTDDVVTRVVIDTAEAMAATLKYSQSLEKLQLQQTRSAAAQAKLDAALASAGAGSDKAVAAQARLDAANRRVVVSEQQVAIAAARSSEVQAAAAQKAAAAQEAAAAKQAAALKKVGTVAGSIGAAVAVGFGVAANAAADFDAKLAQIQTLSGASAAQLSKLSDASKGFTDIGISASQAADAEIELIKAGVSVKDILSGGLSGSLNLAASGQLNVADATSIATAAMTQFGLAGKDIPHIADDLAAGANKSLGSVQDLGEGLKAVGTTAHQAGFGLDETVGALAALAKAGLTAELGGTALKQMFLKLEAPSAKAKALMDQYGISLYDASGNVKSLKDIAGELKTNLTGLDPATRNAALATIFGSRAVQAANVLYQQGAAGIQNWTNKVNDSGAAARTTKGQMDSLNGDLQKLAAVGMNDLIDIGQQLQPILRTVTQDLTSIGNALGDVPDPAKAAAVEFAAITGALGLGFWAFTRIKGAAVNLAETLGILAKAQTDVAVTAGAMAGAEDVAAGAMARESAAARTGFLGGLNKGALGRTGLGIGALLGGSVLSQYSHGQSNGNVAAGIGSNALYGAGIGAFGGPPGALIGGILGALYGAIKNEREHAGPGYTQNPAGNFSGGRTTAGTTWNGQHGQAWLAMDQHPFQVSTAQSTKVLDELGISGDQTSRQLATVGESAQSSGAMFDVLSKAAGAAFDTLNKKAAVFLNKRDAFRNYQQSIDDATAALKQNGATLDANTQKGRDNQAIVDGMAKSAEVYASTISDPVLKLQYMEDARHQLYQTERSFGATKAQAWAYTNQVLGIPKDARTAAAFEANAALNTIAGYEKVLDAVPGFKNTTITVSAQEAENTLLRLIGDLGVIKSKDVFINVNTNYTHSGVQAYPHTGGLIADGKLRKFSGGGYARYIKGPGTGTSDSIPAMVSNGEFVNKASVVRQQGPAAFFALNSGRAKIVPTHYLANGGMVGQSQQWRSGSQQVSVTVSPDALRSALQGTTLMLATDVGTFKATIDGRVRAGVDGAAQQAKRFERAT